MTFGSVCSSLKEPEGGAVSSNSCTKENGRLSEADEPVGGEATPEQVKPQEGSTGFSRFLLVFFTCSNMFKLMKVLRPLLLEPSSPANCLSVLQSSTGRLPQEEAPESDPAGNPEPEPFADRSPARISESPQESEELSHVGDPEPPEKPPSATPDSDSKTLTSEESSEDEEEVTRSAENVGEASSILPSSVLDKASTIAQHFTNSIKRGSLVQDEGRSLSCASPRLLSRTSSRLSLGAEPTDRPLRLSSVSSDHVETFAGTDLTLLSPREDNLFDSGRGIQRRRDSILSKQDQLLICKIKSYYENAESQSPTFSLQRRESLTYIPTGLVRSSVSRLNSVPGEDGVQASSSTANTSSGLELNSAVSTQTGGHVVSSGSLDSLTSDQRSTDPIDSKEDKPSGPHSPQDVLPEDEEFRPSSEMIKIWQTMERDTTRSHREDQLQRADPTTSLCDRSTPCQPENRDLGTISTGPSCLRLQRGNLKDSLKVFGGEAALLKAPPPRVVQLKAEAQSEQPNEDDVDRTKSKVLHLARQYSQRIKTVKPVVRQRSQGLLTGRKSLACVVEEKESAGTSSPSPARSAGLLIRTKLLMSPCSPGKPKTPPLASPLLSPPLTSDPPGSSKAVSPVRARSCSPHSPFKFFSVEEFDWPDVRELRSKYCEPRRSQRSHVSRTHSVPEQMFEGGLRRHSSCSEEEVPSLAPRGSRNAGRAERRQRLHRANSLDPRLSGTQMADMQKLREQVGPSDCDGYRITAEAPLPNDPNHKMIIMEKLSEPVDAAREEEEEDNYVQIRSPTSREKISIMAVIDRCRIYQESDEYRQREEPKAKAEPARSLERDAAAAAPANEDDTSQKRSSNGGQQSIVKNLREKFQNLS